MPSLFSITSSKSGVREDIDSFHIFIKLPFGKLILVWVHASDSVETLKLVLEEREGFPRTYFYFLHEGKVLQEDSRLVHCQISKDSSISLMHHLRGGAEGKRGPSCPSSYKEVACPKGSQTATSYYSFPSPYLVENLESTPTLEIKNP